MIFTGKNLEMVAHGIDLAIAELHNQIAICPDYDHYAEEIEELEQEQERFRRLLARIERAQAKEQSRTSS